MKLFTFLRVEDDIVQLNQIIARDKTEAETLLTFSPDTYTEFDLGPMPYRKCPELLATEASAIEL